MSFAETVETVSALIERGLPTFFITANTHYAMLTEENPDLQQVNARAAFLVADGAPLVWAARHQLVRLPERVAGSDLIFALSDLAARKSYRMFFAGGSPGVAEEAAHQLTARYPGLQVVGLAAPSFRELSAEDYDKLRAQISKAQPHILILAATMPHGERWLSAHFEDLGVPVGVNLGASIDFAAGRINRAPLWMQKSGLEWAFRLMLEPRRLFSRYARNARFVCGRVLHDLCQHSNGPEVQEPTTPRTGSIPKGNRDDHLPDSVPRQFRRRWNRLASLLPKGIRGRPEHHDRPAHVRDDPPAV
jgi:N-acetylglucosaminyldiphosphoundecaprenol N-acetyl-beta-D-mannosaminyltransferase